jgi:hypothetical protein
MNVYLRNALMEYLSGHVGRENAVPRKNIRNFLRTLKPKLNDRDMREIYTECPVCSCRKGLYLPETHEEVEECYAYLLKGLGWRAATRRRRTIYAFRRDLRSPKGQGRLGIEGAGAMS